MFRILLVNGFWIWLNSFSLSFKLALCAGPCCWLLWGNGTMGLITPTFWKAMRTDNRCAELLAVQVSGGCLWEIPIISLGFRSVLLLSCLFPVSPLILLPVSAPVQVLYLAFPFPLWHSSGFLYSSTSFIPDAVLALYSRLWLLPWPFSISLPVFLVRPAGPQICTWNTSQCSSEFFSLNS